MPIAIGHAAAVGGVVLAAALLGRALPLAAIRYLVAAILIGLGIRRLMRHRHPRWVRMRVGFRDLVTWSFLMASAHGAGLMVLPVLLGSSAVHAANQMPGHGHASAATIPLAGLVATIVHTIGYLAATGAIVGGLSQGGLRFSDGVVEPRWAWAAALVSPPRHAGREERLFLSPAVGARVLADSHGCRCPASGSVLDALGCGGLGVSRVLCGS